MGSIGSTGREWCIIELGMWGCRCNGWRHGSPAPIMSLSLSLLSLWMMI